MNTPNLILGGAQRSGTTSLHWLLASHPGTYFPPRPQELHYFDDPANLARGWDWYLAHFRGAEGQPIIGQTSPLYLYEKPVCERVAEALPEVRWIFILRDPVERAYSQYWHEWKCGTEHLGFEEALAAEPERLRGDFSSRRCFSYVDRGRYDEQLARFRERFGRERILVLTHERLRADLDGLRRDLGRFLELDPEGFDPTVGGRRHNGALLPRWQPLQRAVLPLRRRWPRVGYAVDAVNVRPGRYPPMRAETRARLVESYRPHVERLAAGWGLDLGGWLRAP